jgi:hypothetical protein
MRPNLNAIYRLIQAWSAGVVTDAETFERLKRLMSPHCFVPASELVPIGDVAVESQGSESLTIVRRIEIRLTALTNHLDLQLPDELNPKVLFDDVKKLLLEGNSITAMRVHRRRTGCGLAEAKRVFDDFLSRGNDVA